MRKQSVRCFVGVSAILFLFSLAAHAVDVPLLNASFERPSAVTGEVGPADWFLFASTSTPRITVTLQYRKQGVQSCKFVAQPELEAFQGIAQRFTPVVGKTYSFTAYVRADDKSPIAGDAYGQVSLEWQDANGVEISRVYGATWGKDLASSHWSKFTVEAVAPEGAHYGVAVVTFFSKNSAGLGAFYVDDVELKYME